VNGEQPLPAEGSEEIRGGSEKKGRKYKIGISFVEVVYENRDRDAAESIVQGG